MINLNDVKRCRDELTRMTKSSYYDGRDTECFQFAISILDKLIARELKEVEK